MAAKKLPKSTGRPYKGLTVPIETILDLVEGKGLKHSEAARIVGVSRSAITQRLAAIGYKPGRLTQYKDQRADVLAWLQSMIVSYITPEKLKDATLSQLCIAYGILFDKERLVRSQSTSITESRQFIVQAQATLKEARAHLDHLEHGHLEYGHLDRERGPDGQFLARVVADPAGANHPVIDIEPGPGSVR